MPPPITTEDSHPRLHTGVKGQPDSGSNQIRPTQPNQPLGSPTSRSLQTFPWPAPSCSHDPPVALWEDSTGVSAATPDGDFGVSSFPSPHSSGTLPFHPTKKKKERKEGTHTHPGRGPLRFVCYRYCRAKRPWPEKVGALLPATFVSI